MKKLIKIIGAKKISFTPFPIYKAFITHYFSPLEPFHYFAKLDIIPASHFYHYFAKLDIYPDYHYFAKLDTA